MLLSFSSKTHFAMEKILIVQKYSIILLIYVTGGAGSRHLD